MIRLLTRRRYSPIGVDIGTRSVKLVQFSADHSRLVDAARWDLPAIDKSASPDESGKRIVEAIRHAREGRRFRGQEAVVCLTDRQLFLQNVRVPKVDPNGIDRLVKQETAGRLPFAAGEAEIRFVETADVRQGEAQLREVIVMACHRPVLIQMLDVIQAARLRPVAVDVEPAALLRCYAKQFRRDEDRDRRTLIVHIGFSSTSVVIAKGADALFVKYISIGGRDMDQAVARHLKMDLSEATALRRHNGDRRAELREPEVARSVESAVRPVVERLAGELSMCVRYHSVTFLRQPVAAGLIGGGEASPLLAQALSHRLNLKCELSDPLRGLGSPSAGGNAGQWDVAAGLALRQVR